MMGSILVGLQSAMAPMVYAYMTGRGPRRPPCTMRNRRATHRCLRRWYDLEIAREEDRKWRRSSFLRATTLIADELNKRNRAGFDAGFAAAISALTSLIAKHPNVTASDAVEVLRQADRLRVPVVSA